MGFMLVRGRERVETLTFMCRGRRRLQASGELLIDFGK